MSRQVEQFFADYQKANAASDLRAIATLYADTFLFAGPNGVQPVKKEDFLRVIPKMKAHYSALGLVATELQSVEESPLDSKYLLAKVAWNIALQTAAHMQSLEIFATYVLMRTEDGAFLIVFQLDHQDLAAVIKSHRDPSP